MRRAINREHDGGSNPPICIQCMGTGEYGINHYNNMEKQEKEVCGFEYEGRKCECTDVVAISRCFPLCLTHFNTVCSDNMRKFNKGIDILSDMTFTRKLLYSETWSRFGGCLEAEKDIEDNG